ncbi:MAG: hypothetical protein LBB83_01520 [Treponema sp.]|jgi:hypothetical protein|nr:hypothetical protein [Treponema sp.]
MSDDIRWIGQNKHLLVGTETAEWVIPSGVNATNIQAVLNSRYGSDKLQGTSVGDAFCFFQSGKKGLVEYYVPQQDTNFRANNMALLSKNMLHESPAADFDFISAPYTKLFVCRRDGVIASLLYERGTGTFAWGRITTAGSVVSIATLPGESGYDAVYLLVQRDGEQYLERLEEGEAVYLDSFKAWDGNAAGYTDAAVIYDGAAGKTYPVTAPPAQYAAGKTWVGYPYTSRVRSMPILANDRMKPNTIKAISIRFNDSFMPRLKSPNNNKEDTIPQQEPYSGIVRAPFPGVYAYDVFFELIHDTPTRCRALAVNAEVQ